MTELVRKKRLELSRVAPLDPKSSASTNSATFADIEKSTHPIESPTRIASKEALQKLLRSPVVS